MCHFAALLKTLQQRRRRLLRLLTLIIRASFARIATANYNDLVAWRQDQYGWWRRVRFVRIYEGNWGNVLQWCRSAPKPVEPLTHHQLQAPRLTLLLILVLKQYRIILFEYLIRRLDVDNRDINPSPPGGAFRERFVISHSYLPQ